MSSSALTPRPPKGPEPPTDAGSDPADRSLSAVLRRIPGSALLRFGLLALLLLAGFLAVRWTPLGEILSRQNLAAQIESVGGSPWAPPLLVLLWLLFSAVGIPVSPLVFAGGALFGPLWGSIYNFAGSMLGAALAFGLGHTLGRDLIVHLLGRKRLNRIAPILRRHSFWTILRLRFLPVPFAILNYGSALAGVPSTAFLTASAAGMAPAVSVYTYFSHALISVTAADRPGLLRRMAVALLLLLLLTFLPRLLGLRKKNAGS